MRRTDLSTVKVQRDSIINDLDILKTMANLRGNNAAVFKFKEMVVGSKKAVSGPALFDQFNSCEVTKPDIIKSVPPLLITPLV